MLLEKMNGFAEKNYEVAVSANQIAEDYEAKRTDAWQEIENLNIAKRIISTCMSQFVTISNTLTEAS
jgi:amphiphysin